MRSGDFILGTLVATPEVGLDDLRVALDRRRVAFGDLHRDAADDARDLALEPRDALREVLGGRRPEVEGLGELAHDRVEERCLDRVRSGGVGVLVGPLPADLAGTLVLTERTASGDVRQAFDVSAKLDPAFVPSGTLSAVGGEAIGLAESLLFALLGGLILNLMPCVFPVLAMKAAAIARLAGEERNAMRRDGFAYTAGDYQGLITELDKRGFALVTHAINPVAVHAVLDAYEMLTKTNGVKDRRLRMEHLFNIPAADMTRLKKLKRSSTSMRRNVHLKAWVM